MKIVVRLFIYVTILCATILTTCYCDNTSDEVDRATLLKEETKLIINQFQAKTNELKESLRLKFESRKEGIAPGEKAIKKEDPQLEGSVEPEVPIQSEEEKLVEYLNNILQSNLIVVFGMSYCPFTEKAIDILRKEQLAYHKVYLDEEIKGSEIKDQITDRVENSRLPAIFVEGVYIGGRESLSKLLKNNKEVETLKQKSKTKTKPQLDELSKFKDLI